MGIPSWEESFEQSNFGDKRRTKRVIKVANQIDAKCDIKGASAVLRGHGELKAVSRLLKCSQVNPDNLTEGFMNINCSSITEEHILIIEDTSEMNFAWRNKPIDGLGPTGNSEDQGFFIHPSIMVEPDKEELLGIAALKVITRVHGQKTTKNEQYKDKDITEKESYKWIDAPRKGIERLPEHVTKTIVADREADIYDLFLEQHLGSIGTKCELLIRTTHNRKIIDNDRYLNEIIDSWEVKGTHKVSIEGNGARRQRIAQCQIRFGTATIAVPKAQKKRKDKRPVPDVNYIDIRETDCPADEKPLHWTLATTWSIRCIEDAVEKIEWYRCRWIIEELFRVLKSGYHVESVRFDDGSALINWCALRLLMAVKLMYIRTHRNDESENSAHEIFTDIELNILKQCEPNLISAKSTIHRPPVNTMAWASLLIAIMGGYQALPSAKPFGQTTIWRGLVYLESAVAGYCAAIQNSG